MEKLSAVLGQKGELGWAAQLLSLAIAILITLLGLRGVSSSFSRETWVFREGEAPRSLRISVIVYRGRESSNFLKFPAGACYPSAESFRLLTLLVFVKVAFNLWTCCGET